MASNHDEDVVELLAALDLRRERSLDLVTEAEHVVYELAKLKAKSESSGPHHDYCTCRLRNILGELRCRRRLERYGGPL